jgi:hypothetical protein
MGGRDQPEQSAVRFFERRLARQGFSTLYLNKAAPLRISLFDQIASHNGSLSYAIFALQVRKGV